MNELRKLCIAAGIAASVTGVAPANAGVIELGFVLDSSGSITAAGWDTIRDGLSGAVNLIPVTGPDIYEVSVVTFATTATININSVSVNSLAARTALAAQIAALPFLGSTTNFQDAFNKMQTALTDGIGTPASAADASYVNFSTDGVPNAIGAGGTAATQPVAEAAGATARNAFIAAGIDNLSVEGIGGAVNVGYLTGSICSPQPCDTTIPFNFPAQGFYLGVPDPTAYANAIGNKVRLVTRQLPEPGTLALLGVAFAGMGFASRRKLN